MRRQANSVQPDSPQPASSPAEIPVRGWKAIAARLWHEISEDHISVVAAGIAFYALIALFPAIAALVGLSDVFLDPGDLAGELTRLSSRLPPSAAAIVEEQVVSVTDGNGARSGLVALIGIAIAIYGAMKGVLTLIEGLNIAYDEQEKRGLVRLYLTALALTLAILFGFLLTVGLALILPAIINLLPLGALAETLVPWASWLVLAIFTMVGLAVVYRFGPSREPPRWRWISPGAALATLIWIGGTAAFSLYVQQMGSYAETYGALGGVIVLLTWLWLSAFCVLAGAELNSEIERQVGRSTDKQPAPQSDVAKALQPADTTTPVESTQQNSPILATRASGPCRLSPLLLFAGLVICQAIRRDRPTTPPKAR
ncbi:YihY/virulence factor BrkB family protein [Paracoccus aestuariivivens]|uniref:YihY family inner membrane protein n=1 Tax=Paracoccus aestuariivivens TaxID=1820333 RepID=A0A6L6JEH6_9RHOB|nr:YihY/virulence factor BrkB family protein [Paracoccus aestuariivivens]MTH79916.1 YihY family inner membrane protein [Paracoccus aestuariivivens]